ncbi:small hydrophobic protein [Ninove microtus virus]|uniref:Small hydrophobic protein n=1 Tax=Ninove microtus virus TaxID=2940990 RepID=A0AAE9HQA3_9MONO|nr:small hydrophobic protein [Ninove microtus virus]
MSLHKCGLESLSDCTFPYLTKLTLESIRMERDAAILLFIIGFIMVFWLIVSVSWLLYLTIKIYKIRTELTKKIADIYHEFLCPPTDEYCPHVRLSPLPPAYNEIETTDS